jgi:hypothetical protein
MADDTTDTSTDPGYSVEVWKGELKRARKAFQNWERDSDKIVKRYRDDDKDRLDSDAPRFSVLWSNTQTLIPAVYARPPQPVVQRRFLDRDPVARLATQILERGLKYEIENGDLHEAVKLAVEDYALVARGQAWVRYDAKFSVARMLGQDGMPVMDGGEPLTSEKIDSEQVPVDYIARKDFLHAPARIWREVPWVAKRAYLSREKLITLAGEEIGRRVPLNCGPDGADEKNATPSPEELRRAEVWEIWCRDTKRVHWICPDFDEPIKEMDDPLNLRDFFPCPEPLYGTKTTDSLVPVPDYHQYRGQALEMDELCRRTDRLIAACKVVGTYDAANTSLARMLTEGVENELIANENWAAFAQNGGLKGSMDFLPLDQFVVALKEIYEARANTKADIYEITGLSDIVRGDSDPDETATAQQLKGQYASLRLRSRQSEVQRFARDLIRIMAEIMCEQFRPETFWEMAGAQELEGAQDPATGQPNPQFLEQFKAACQLLRDERTRGFKIDIETDSTIAPDENAEKQSRAEFLEAVGGLMGQALPAVEKYPAIAPLIGHMILFAVRGFRVGRELEGIFEEAVDQLERQPMQPKPDPEQQKVEQAKQLAEIQVQAKQQDMELTQQEHEMEMAHEQQKMQLERDKMALEIERDRQKGEQQMELERQRGEQGIQIEQQKFDIARADRQAQQADRDASEQAKAEARTPAPDYTPQIMEMLAKLSQRRTPLGAKRTPEGLQLIYED